MTEFSAGISAGAASLGPITTGPDGNLWFAERVSGAGYGRVGRITPAGAVTEYLVACAAGGYFGGLAWGPDGALWLTQPDLDAIVRVSQPGGGCLKSTLGKLKLGKLKTNARKGTAVLTVTTPAGGKLKLTGTGIVKIKRELADAATVRLRLKAKNVTLTKLRRDGVVRRSVTVTLETPLGETLTKTRRVKLVLK